MYREMQNGLLWGQVTLETIQKCCPNDFDPEKNAEVLKCFNQNKNPNPIGAIDLFINTIQGPNLMFEKSFKTEIREMVGYHKNFLVFLTHINRFDTELKLIDTDEIGSIEEFLNHPLIFYLRSVIKAES